MNSLKKFFNRNCIQFSLENCELFVFFQRTEKQLRKCWDNLKTDRKKEIGSAKRAAMETGGGPAVKIPKYDEMDIFTDTFGSEIEGAMDSDTLALAESGNDKFFVVSESGNLMPLPKVTLEVDESINNSNQGKFLLILKMIKFDIVSAIFFIMYCMNFSNIICA